VVDLVAGSFSISFLAAQRGNFQVGPQTIVVKVDGNTVGTIMPSSTSYASFTTNSFSIATTGLHTISFSGTNSVDATAFLDAVSVTRLT
jgi:hypothetical protein